MCLYVFLWKTLLANWTFGQLDTLHFHDEALLPLARRDLGQRHVLVVLVDLLLRKLRKDAFVVLGLGVRDEVLPVVPHVDVGSDLEVGHDRIPAHLDGLSGAFERDPVALSEVVLLLQNPAISKLELGRLTALMLHEMSSRGPDSAVFAIYAQGFATKVSALSTTGETDWERSRYSRGVIQIGPIHIWANWGLISPAL